jgi:hypothetical protein
MSRYILKIGDRSVAIFDAPKWVRASDLVGSIELRNRLKDCTSAGVALWDGVASVNYRRASDEDEQKWQAVHRRRNAEFGIDEDQGLAVWLVPMDSGDDSIMFKDDWGLWREED